MNKKKQLHHIITNHAIKPVFQPIVSLKTGNIFGYETLSRITDKECTINIEELFQLASEEGELWELEKLCRYRSLKKFSKFKCSKKLFLNVDGNIIQDPELKSGYTKKLLKRFCIDFSNIILEITESNSIDAEFTLIMKQTMEHYREQNFTIAIDDYGCGYSGLNRVCHFKPEYLKLDLQLIRDIDSNKIKKSAVSNTIQFCKENNIKVIAEGIETKDELDTLIELGADFGQGYYLSKPSEQPKEIPQKIIMEIKEKNYALAHLELSEKISSIGKQQLTVFDHTPSLLLYNKMKQNTAIEEFFVLNTNQEVIGILTRNHVLEKYGGPFGYSLSQKLSAQELMEDCFLSVDTNCSIESVAKTAMERPLRHVYDAIAVTENEKYICTVSVKALLLASIQIRTKYASDASPLTGLPGNSRIQEMIKTTFLNHKTWSLAYFDLDNFKAYNDAYSFENGDKMIKLLAELLKSKTGDHDFCGHIGGDDFILITHHYGIEQICQEICNEFTAAIKSLYKASDWNQGFIISTNRAGQIEQFPLASLSIAIITNEKNNPNTLDELFQTIADTKKKCKKRSGHSIICV